MYTSLYVGENIEDWIIMTAYGRPVAKQLEYVPKGVVNIP